MLGMLRWTEKASETKDITEGLEKLPQEVASAPDSAETEDITPPAADNKVATPSAHPKIADEDAVAKSTEEKAPESGAPLISLYYCW